MMMMMRLCEWRESKKLVKKEESGLEKRMSEWSKDEPKNHTQKHFLSEHGPPTRAPPE